jgi:cytochrome c biogenesis protein CcmG, thiol:disulfide interchange protein DsbE
MSVKRISWRALLVWGGLAVALALLVAFGLSGSKGAVGRRAPALPAERLSGAAVSLAALRGRPALVVFWASWCTPCEQEAPALERFARSLRSGAAGGRAVLVGVNWSDPSASNARAFVRRFGWTFPNLRDGNDTVGERYGVSGLPTTFAIDASGRVRAELRGPQTQASLRRALAAASA